MKGVKKITILTIMFLLLGIIVSLSSGSNVAQQFDSHGPIVIIGNSELIEFVQNESLTGDGSQGRPYSIQGLAFTYITVEDTDLYFEIKDNQITNAAEFGIAFYNVTHGTISGNTLQNAYLGAILLDNSDNNSVVDNTVSQNEISGIRLMKSHNNTVTGNTVSNNGGTHDGARVCGIYLERSHENVITDNIIDKNANVGLNIPLSNQNLISGNIISNHLVSGIDMAYGVGPSWTFSRGDYNEISKNELYSNVWGISLRGNSNTISENEIYKNSIGIFIGLDNYAEDIRLLAIDPTTAPADNTEIVSNEIHNNSLGLLLEKSTDGSIMNNSLYFNTGYAVSIKSGSITTNVKQNDFIANRLEGTSQASDDGTSSTFLNNYWYEWTSPDSDSDSIVDEPYTIDGSTSNSDSSPLTTAFNPSSPSDVKPPQANTSSGWTLGFLLLTFLPLVMIRKRK